MKSSDANHYTLKAQETLLQVARKAEVLTQKAEREPGRMAAKALTKGADILVVAPGKVLAKATLVGTKEFAKAGGWAIKAAWRGAVTGSRGAAAAVDGLSSVDVVKLQTISEKPAAAVYAEQINHLQDGLGYALAKADFLSKHPPSIELDVGQYLKLSGIIAAEKIPKMMLMSAAIHTFGLGATALGHLLAPGVEEAALQAAGVGHPAVQLGLGIGLIHALHSPMSEALRKSNILQKDSEWGNYTSQVNAARQELQTITKALHAVQNLHVSASQGDGLRVKKSLLRTIERGVRQAESLVVSARTSETLREGSAKMLAGHLQAAADFVLSLGIAADEVSVPVAQAVVAVQPGSLLSRTSPTSSRLSLAASDEASEKSWSRSAHRIEFLRAKRQSDKTIADSEKRLHGLHARRERLEVLAKQRPDDGSLRSDLARVQLRLVAEYARRDSLQHAERTDVQARLVKAENNVAAERLGMRHAASALDADLAASLAKQYERRHSHYNDRYHAQRKRFEQKMTKLQDHLETRATGSIDDKLLAQQRRYEAKLSIIVKKGYLASLDAEFSAHLAEPGALPNDTASLANRRQYLKIMRQLERARVDALAFSDAQKRTSVYVAPDAKLMESSPALVRGTAQAGRFLFGVIPGINLPWWSVRWGQKQIATRRLESSMRRVTSPIGRTLAARPGREESETPSIQSIAPSAAMASSQIEAGVFSAGTMGPLNQ